MVSSLNGESRLYAGFGNFRPPQEWIRRGEADGNDHEILFLSCLLVAFTRLRRRRLWSGYGVLAGRAALVGEVKPVTRPIFPFGATSAWSGACRRR